MEAEAEAAVVWRAALAPCVLRDTGKLERGGIAALEPRCGALAVAAVCGGFMRGILVAAGGFVGRFVGLGGGDKLVKRGEPVALTEKGLRRPVLLARSAADGFGILDAGT